MVTERERVAEAIWNATPGEFEWSGMGEASPTKQIYRKMADAAIAAVDAARAEHQPTDAQILGSLVVPGSVDGT